MNSVLPTSYPSADLGGADDWYGSMFNGSGDWYGSMFGLDGAISSQADYNALTKAQKLATTIMAEISGIGKEAWDRVRDVFFDQHQWSPSENYGYDNMMGFWFNNVKSIVVTPSKKPTIEQVNEVIRLAGGTENLIKLVKNYIPDEDRVRGEADRANTEAMMQGSYKSPGTVGWETFQQELADRASKLVTVGVGLGTIAAIAVGLMAAAYLLRK